MKLRLLVAGLFAGLSLTCFTAWSKCSDTATEPATQFQCSNWATQSACVANFQSLGGDQYRLCSWNSGSGVCEEGAACSLTDTD